MALVKCPECGNSISSTVDQCIHCGCKITCCAECGIVLVGKVSTCPECGAILCNESKIGNEEKKIKEKSTVKNIAVEWDAETKNKAVKRRPLLIIALLLGLASIGILWGWHTADPFTALARYNIVKYGTIAISITSVTLYFIKLYYAKNDEYTSKTAFLSCLKKNGTDGQIFIENYTNTALRGKTAEQVRIERVAAITALHALIIKDDSAYNASYQRYIKSYCFLSLLVHAAVEFFLIENIIGSMEHALWESDNYFNHIDNWWLIGIATGIWVARCVLSVINTRKYNNASKKWFEKNMPEYGEKFNKRALEALTYMP